VVADAAERLAERPGELVRAGYAALVETLQDALAQRMRESLGEARV